MRDPDAAENMVTNKNMATAEHRKKKSNRSSGHTANNFSNETSLQTLRSY